MKRRMILSIAVGLVLVPVGGFLFAGTDGGDKPAAADAAAPRVADLTWLKGDWGCTLGSTPVQEHWFDASGGALMGACAMGADPARNVFEVLLIEDSPAGLTLTLKHFKAGLSHHFGAEPLKYQLVRHGPEELVFENPQTIRHKQITYRREGKRLVCKLAGGGSDGKHEMEFRMSRPK